MLDAQGPGARLRRSSPRDACPAGGIRHRPGADTVRGPARTVHYTFNKPAAVDPAAADPATAANWNPSEPGYAFPGKSGTINVNNGGTVSHRCGAD